MKKSFFACLFIISVSMAHAQNDGETAFSFLRLPVSAHASALGGDNVSVVDDDVMMMFHNPALIVGASPKTIGLQYMNYMSGCNNASAAYKMTVSEKYHVGIGASFMSYGSMTHTDASGNVLGDFSAKDFFVSGTLAYDLLKNVAGGITLKYAYSNIGSYNAMAVAADIGLNWYDPETEWSVGLVVKNLGGQVKAYDEDFEKLPLDVQLGVTKRLVGSPLRLSATLVDLDHPGDKFWNHLCFGAELFLASNIYVGGGYNFRRASEMEITDSENEVSSHGAGLSLGGGVALERIKFNVSYAKYHVSSNSLMLNIAYQL